MRLWQISGAVACLGLWAVLAFANIVALTSLGSTTSFIHFAGYQITTKQALGALAVVADILLISSGFAVGYWWNRQHEVTATCAAVVWVICAAVSWHSTDLWLKMNIAAVITPAAQSQDFYKSLVKDLDLAQEKVDWVMSLDTKRFNRSERRETKKNLAAAEARVVELRKLLSETEVVTPAHPIKGFETLAATGLLMLNALSWLAIFGGGSGAPDRRETDGKLATGSGGLVATGDMPKFAIGLTPENTWNFNAVTPPSPVAESTPQSVAEKPSRQLSRAAARKQRKALASSVMKPRPPEPPPGTRQAVAKTDGKSANIVAINSAASNAVKGWVDNHTVKSNGGFVATSEAWQIYQETGPVGVHKDYFCKVLKESLGKRNYARKGGLRGYAGIRLVEDREWRRAV